MSQGKDVTSSPSNAQHMPNNIEAYNQGPPSRKGNLGNKRMQKRTLAVTTASLIQKPIRPNPAVQARSCDTSGLPRQGLCSRCKQHSHIGNNCDGSLVRCYICNGAYHKANACPFKETPPSRPFQRLTPRSQPSNSEAKTKLQAPRVDVAKCYNCQKPTHPGMKCNGSPITCYICKELGHKANVCPNKTLTASSTSAATKTNYIGIRIQGRIYCLTEVGEEDEESLDIIAGTSSVNFVHADVLFNTGAKKPRTHKIIYRSIKWKIMQRYTQTFPSTFKFRGRNSFKGGGL